MFHRHLIAWVAAGWLAFGAAHAAMLSGALSGTIAGNTRDTCGWFGPIGGDLSGRSLTASYRYDTGAAAMHLLQPGTEAYLGDGNLTLQVSIGGVTVAPAGVTESEIAVAGAGPDSMVTLAMFAPTPLLDFTLFVVGAWVPGVTLDAPLTVDPRYYGQTIYVSADGSHYDTLNFVAVSLPVAMPEPAPLAWLGAALVAAAAARAWR